MPKPSQEGVKRLADTLDRLSRAQSPRNTSARDAEALRRQAQDMLDKLSPSQRDRVKEWAEALAKEQQRRGTPPPQPPDSSDLPGPSQSAARPSAESGQPQPPEQPGDSPSLTDRSQRPDPSSGSSADTPGSSSAPIARRSQTPASSPRTELVDARRQGQPDADAPAPRVAAEWLGPGQPASPGTASNLDQTLREAAKSAERAVEDRTVPRRFDRLLERYFRRLPDRVKAPVTPAPDAPPAPAKDAP